MRTIEEANRHLLIVISELRRGARLADEHDDPGTVDLFSKTIQIHEKQEWGLRDILRKGTAFADEHTKIAAIFVCSW